ncbi:enamine deaminase RidA [Ruegeria marisrubri]|uniref:Enamine deaminase RidA n=1 Tax=Ruegeria marisrubri TaxID=1685379 RepID=A0A0X3TQA7_9RHOB|nr:RidA family protein [Ruegeria marisrubri]KUJ77945.1 enamine deaminase RidA [Ruegeria marisrubri]
MSNQVIHPEGWAPAKGYANGILSDDGTLYVGGQVGWTSEQRFEAHDFIGQMEQALRNILDIVQAAGGAAQDITRLTWFVVDKEEYLARQKEVGEAYRKVMGRHFPAMSLVVVAGLVEDGALLEIEATAKLKNRL